jgi:hypothetical protein
MPGEKFPQYRSMLFEHLLSSGISTLGETRNDILKQYIRQDESR